MICLETCAVGGVRRVGPNVFNHQMCSPAVLNPRKTKKLGRPQEKKKTRNRPEISGKTAEHGKRKTPRRSRAAPLFYPLKIWRKLILGPSNWFVAGTAGSGPGNERRKSERAGGAKKKKPRGVGHAGRRASMRIAQAMGV